MGSLDRHDPLPTLPVTAVIARRPWPGRESELGQWADGFVAAAGEFEGYVEARIYPPTPPENDDLVIAMTFESAAALSVWEHSEVRARMREQARPLVLGRPRSQSMSALDGIFGDGTRTPFTPPPRWKTAIVIVLAIYPFTVLLQWGLSTQIAGWPFWLRALPTSVLAPVYVTWVGAPAVSRLLRKWLQR